MKRNFTVFLSVLATVAVLAEEEGRPAAPVVNPGIGAAIVSALNAPPPPATPPAVPPPALAPAGSTQASPPALTPAEMQALGTSEAELRELGRQVEQGDKLHAKRLEKLQAQVRQIERTTPPGSPQRQQALQQATSQYTQDSQRITEQYRQPAQKRLTELANRSANAEYEAAGTSAKEVRQLEKTAATPGRETAAKAQAKARLAEINQKMGRIANTEGTAVGDPKHRGWQGDTDAGANSRRVARVEKIANKMGLSVEGKPGYVEVQKMNLAAHKGGPLGTPGSSAHQAQVQIGAAAKETYVSSSMKPNQPGRSFVEVQDHAKKARAGLNTDAKRLLSPQNAGKLQTMAKGISKAITSGRVTNAQLDAILKKNGLDGMSGKQFRDLLGKLKGNAALAPEGAGVRGSNIRSIQQACKDALAQANKNSARQVATSFAKVKQTVKTLETRAAAAQARGQTAEARQLRNQANQLRKDLLDSKIKVKATHAANQPPTKTPAGKPAATATGPAKRTPGPIKAGFKPSTPPTGKPPAGATTPTKPTPPSSGGGTRGKTTVRTPPSPPVGPVKPGSSARVTPPAKVTTAVSSRGAKPVTPPTVKPGTPPATPATAKPGTPSTVKPGTPPATPATAKPGTPSTVKPGVSRPGTAPTKPGVPPGSTPPPTLKAKVFNGGMLLVSIYGIYQGVKQGVLDAVADSDEAKEGTTARGLRGGAYAVWYGLGLKGAADIGREEGNTFMDEYHADLYLNKIPPNSWTATGKYIRAKTLGVASAMAKFAQLEAAHDLMTETGGLIEDTWGWLKAWLAEREMNQRRARYLTVKHRQNDSYCTNRPIIQAPVALPPSVTKKP